MTIFHCLSIKGSEDREPLLYSANSLGYRGPQTAAEGPNPGSNGTNPAIHSLYTYIHIYSFCGYFLDNNGRVK